MLEPQPALQLPLSVMQHLLIPLSKFSQDILFFQCLLVHPLHHLHPSDCPNLRNSTLWLTTCTLYYKCQYYIVYYCKACGTNQWHRNRCLSHWLERLQPACRRNWQIWGQHGWEFPLAMSAATYRRNFGQYPFWTSPPQTNSLQLQTQTNLCWPLLSQFEYTPFFVSPING